MCIDYKSINKVTDTDVYPLPRVEQLLEDVTQLRYITLDLTKGYYQFPMHPEHQQKTAFVTPQGKWEFTRMLFGLKGAPARFQRTMDQSILNFVPTLMMWLSIARLGNNTYKT